MIGSFYVGYTGLTSNNKYLNIISDNIANVNTVGFKAEVPIFEDILQSAITSFTAGGTPVNFEIGGGEVLSSTVKNFTQGIFMQTGNPTDLAIDGKGLFILTDGQTTYYSRNGEFRLDPEGNLINQQGLKVLGWKLDREGNMVGAMRPINIPLSMNPNATTQVKLNEPSNLNAGEDSLRDKKNRIMKFNPANNKLGYSHAESITVYDSLGNPHLLEFYFEHIAQNKWYSYLLIDGREVEFKKTDSNGTHYVGGLMLEFDNEGKLANVYYSGFVGCGDTNNGKIKVTLKNTTSSSATFYISGVDTNHNFTSNGSSNIYVKSDPRENKLFVLSDTNSANLGESSYILEPGSVVVQIGPDSNHSTFIDNGHGYLYKLIDSVNWVVDKSAVYGDIDYAKGEITFTKTEIDTNYTKINFKLLKVRDTNGQEIYAKIRDTRTLSLDKDWMVPFNPYTGAQKMQFDFDFSKLTQLASSYMFFGYQNGNSKGDLMNISVGEDGSIRGSYTNGLTIPIARIALAMFKDTEMLRRVGSTLYIPSSPTYTPVIVPGGVISKIRSQMLEASNVDLAQEFINLMVAQRAYQANARVISTSDQVLLELINLKR